MGGEARKSTYLFRATNGRFRRILLKNSLSAMFDFLGGLWARHSKNQLGDQPICRLGSVRGPQPVCDGAEQKLTSGIASGFASNPSSSEVSRPTAESRGLPAFIFPPL
jgi:hypothetical protein